MKTVVITDARSSQARALIPYLSGLGYQVQVPPDGCRLWKEADVRAFAAACPRPLAGVIHPAPPFSRCSLEEADESLVAKARDEGPLAAWCVARVFCDMLREQGSGSLIFLNSIHAEKPMGYGFLFSAGCGAVQMLNREISQDAGTGGVRTFFIQRGPMEGDPDLKSDISHFYYGTDLRYPLRSIPAADQLNDLVAFLLTPAASPLAGSDLRADGGMTMYYGERRKDSLPAPPRKFAEYEIPDKPHTEAEQRVALVTGSGKGVGAGIVRVLCAAGIKCVVHCNSNRALAQKTLEQIQASGGEAFLCQADVSDPAQAQRLVDETVNRYGRLDILVNNAALQMNLFVDEYREETLRHLWDVNFAGYWRMIRAALPWLRKSPAPRIINIGSVHGKRPTCFDTGYAMTKGGIKMLTREAAIELQADGIPVNCLSLGGVRIEFKTGDPDFHNRRPRETLNMNLRNRDRLVLPEEVGSTVLYLCSEPAAALTGDCIRIDCGQMLK